jgi:hypothetical protein
MTETQLKNAVSDVELIRQPQTIRKRCQQIYIAAQSHQLKHWKLNDSLIPSVCQLVLDITKQNYPDGKIPYHSRWSHFAVGGRNRIQWLNQQLSSTFKSDLVEQARVHYDLVVPSILLDAGAGMAWSYLDRTTSQKYSKSEGLAVASFDMFAEGYFSSSPVNSFQADAQGLQKIRVETLEAGFQISETNPIVGMQGRLTLLKNLGKVLENTTYFGGPKAGRIGALVDYLIHEFGATEIKAIDIFNTVLGAFSEIWPGRLTIDGVNLGDVWQHSLVKGPGATDKLVPFHKLSQWLTYSLMEPLEWIGIKVTHIDQLTGLAEYRNGGLFVDSKVLTTKDPDALKREYHAGDEFIVEWRALTVCLLDQVADHIRKDLGKSTQELPLAKILQGGTWAAGRVLASKERPDGGSPIKIKSDGTVF